eukprot:45164-Pyramimonas_sp.AAC.1
MHFQGVPIERGRLWLTNVDILCRGNTARTGRCIDGALYTDADHESLVDKAKPDQARRDREPAGPHSGIASVGESLAEL